MLAITFDCGESLKVFTSKQMLLKLENDKRWLLGEHCGGVYDVSNCDMINCELVEHLKSFNIHCVDTGSHLNVNVINEGYLR